MRRAWWRPSPAWALKSLSLLLLLLLFVAFALGPWVQGSSPLETIRFVYDRLTCTPAWRRHAHVRSLSEPGPDGQAGLARLGPPNCTRVHPRVRVPRVYVADAELESALGPRCAECAEFPVYDQIRANVTRTLVTDPAHADVVLFPFPADCQDARCAKNPDLDFARAARLALDPLRARFPHLQFFTVSRRPFPARTNLRAPMRQLLADYPHIKFLSPDIKNMQSHELRDPHLQPILANHVVLPQFPVDFPILTAPFDPAWPRPYRFCFQGTLLNAERTMVADALLQRNDSFVQGNCRSDRANLAATSLRTDESALLYAQCEYCPTPRGDTNCDTRFFDALRVGCIPIVTNALRPAPYIRHVDYHGWVETFLHDTNTPRFQRFLDHLANQPAHARHQQRLRMRDAALHLTHASCNGAPGLHYALASLLEDRTHLEDLWGFTLDHSL
ncbi:uncharacterized protein MONBRDRAFT_30215 [Monosiga brevicollis MX1]|uniref:Exostosin GT47 domain-containing protein n=1 Tax=Monosiga brevicollis TaxID=81824 RepID=A9VDB8_MONBE|nr:uncharacterized protein MONBRDRAFT_30215 [Monosiga brevicollis MX1]EDQ84446.1 predicted protein [Monosiga brevicollis MX1]|eukprot:XP_001750741.1 hypothetical protein [Monosiga brevicollis MX1]